LENEQTKIFLKVQMSVINSFLLKISEFFDIDIKFI